MNDRKIWRKADGLDLYPHSWGGCKVRGSQDNAIRASCGLYALPEVSLKPESLPLSEVHEDPAHLTGLCDLSRSRNLSRSDGNKRQEVRKGRGGGGRVSIGNAMNRRELDETTFLKPFCKGESDIIVNIILIRILRFVSSSSMPRHYRCVIYLTAHSGMGEIRPTGSPATLPTRTWGDMVDYWQVW